MTSDIIKKYMNLDVIQVLVAQLDRAPPKRTYNGNFLEEQKPQVTHNLIHVSVAQMDRATAS